MEQTADIALIGLAVMGQNLILNMNDHGYTVVAYNRTVSKVDEFLNDAAKGRKTIIGARSVEEMVGLLKRPRKIMLMVKAGQAVDDFIESLLPHLEPGDLDGEARAKKLRTLRKHLEWLARKRELRNHVLHSFTHLAGASADGEGARVFLAELASSLTERGASVQQTPFGWSCAWELEVYGESLAKVWKEI